MSGGLRLESISIGIAGRALFDRLDLTIAGGEIVTLMGPSGSGKSTLVAFIGGHLDRTFKASGRILIDEVDVTSLPAERRRIGILFQDDLLFPHLSVGDNLAFGLARSVKGAARRARINEALTQAGLAGFADRDPATLSGGQRARAALLRTMLAKPRALLIDEPFSKLDASLRHEFRILVFDHARALGLPILLVTHEAADAEAAGGRVLTLA